MLAGILLEEAGLGASNSLTWTSGRPSRLQPLGPGTGSPGWYPVKYPGGESGGAAGTGLLLLNVLVDLCMWFGVILVGQLGPVGVERQPRVI